MSFLFCLSSPSVILDSPSVILDIFNRGSSVFAFVFVFISFCHPPTTHQYGHPEPQALVLSEEKELSRSIYFSPSVIPDLIGDPESLATLFLSACLIFEVKLLY